MGYEIYLNKDDKEYISGGYSVSWNNDEDFETVTGDSTIYETINRKKASETIQILTKVADQLGKKADVGDGGKYTRQAK